MNRTELENLIFPCSDDGREDVYIEIDGTLYDFEVGLVEEVFDGFDTVYPACYKLVPKKDDI